MIAAALRLLPARVWAQLAIVCLIGLVALGLWRAGYNAAKREYEVDKLQSRISALRATIKDMQEARKLEMEQIEAMRKVEADNRIIFDAFPKSDRPGLTKRDIDWLLAIK